MIDKKMLSPEQAQILADFELGRRLADTTNSLGWKDVLDILEEDVMQAEHHLMNYNGTDREIIAALHRRARDKREMFQNMQIRINNAINTSLEVPATIASVGVPNSGAMA
jgi:hypothetical protein